MHFPASQIFEFYSYILKYNTAYIFPWLYRILSYQFLYIYRYTRFSTLLLGCRAYMPTSGKSRLEYRKQSSLEAMVNLLGKVILMHAKLVHQQETKLHVRARRQAQLGGVRAQGTASTVRARTLLNPLFV